MSDSSNPLQTGNEYFNLINFLYLMYNDNITQINHTNNLLNNLHRSNTQIRDAIFRLLSTPEPNQRQTINTRLRNRENNRNVNNDVLYLNGRPYVIDSVSQYNIQLPRDPLNNGTRTDGITQLLQNFLNPIEIYPTQAQIETATRRVYYRDISRPSSTQCPISMEEFNDSDLVTVIRHCGHIFHTEHLDRWFRTNCRCPVCRYDIRDYRPNSNETGFTNATTVTNSNDNHNNYRTTAQSSTYSLFPSFNNNEAREVNDPSGNIRPDNGATHFENQIIMELFGEIMNGNRTTDASGNSLDSLLSMGSILNSITRRPPLRDM